MRVIRPEEFKKMAQEVVDNYLQRSIPLTDGLAKVATENALNPDQLKNLVQLANTMTHLTLFDQRNDGDKIVEFNPADPADVTKKVFVDGEPTSEGCSNTSSCDEGDMFGDLNGVLDKVKDVLRGASDSTSVPTEQSAAPEAPTADANSSSPNPAKRQMLIIKIRKVASELENRQYETAYGYREELDKTAAEFAKQNGPDFETFEKDAFALRGDMAIPIINDLRGCLRMPSTKVDEFPKLARVVDSKTDEMRSLDELIKLNADYTAIKEARAHIQESVGEYL